MTRWFEAHTVRRFGRFRQVEPLVVIEVAFDVIQRSNRHQSGFALRFPRIVRLRTDKQPTEIDTLATVERLHRELQYGAEYLVTAEARRPEKRRRLKLGQAPTGLWQASQMTHPTGVSGRVSCQHVWRLRREPGPVNAADDSHGPAGHPGHHPESSAPPDRRSQRAGRQLTWSWSTPRSWKSARRRLVARAAVSQVQLDGHPLRAHDRGPTDSGAEMRTPKQAIRATLLAPPFTIEGQIHLPTNRSCRLALEAYGGRFVPVTGASYWAYGVAEVAQLRRSAGREPRQGPRRGRLRRGVAVRSVLRTADRDPRRTPGRRSALDRQVQTIAPLGPAAVVDRHVVAAHQRQGEGELAGAEAGRVVADQRGAAGRHRPGATAPAVRRRCGSGPSAAPWWPRPERSGRRGCGPAAASTRRGRRTRTACARRGAGSLGDPSSCATSLAVSRAAATRRCGVKVVGGRSSAAVETGWPMAPPRRPRPPTRTRAEFEAVDAPASTTPGPRRNSRRRRR